MENLAQIKEKVKVCIIDALELKGVSPSDIENDASFFGTEDTPGLIQDSLAVLEIASRISEEFDVSPSEFGESSFQSVNTLSDKIFALLAKESLAASN